MTDEKRLPPLLKLALELGPLALFFIGNAYGDRFGFAQDQRIFAATGIFIVATVIALGISYGLTRKLPIMPVVSGIVVVVFGGLTLFLQDETFIKLKPTIIYLLFAAVLVGGLMLRKPLLAMVFDAMFHLTDEGWRKLTVRWAAFFFALAVLNEIVWRTQSTDTWVSFKVFGIVPLTFVFAAAQMPLMRRYDASGAAAKE
jgi:intracellular septation protein